MPGLQLSNALQKRMAIIFSDWKPKLLKQPNAYAHPVTNLDRVYFVRIAAKEWIPGVLP